MDYLQISDGQYTKTIYTMVRKLIIVSGTIKRLAGSRRQRSHEIVMFVISGGLYPAWGVFGYDDNIIIV